LGREDDGFWRRAWISYRHAILPAWLEMQTLDCNLLTPGDRYAIRVVAELVLEKRCGISP
jgi:hypothetical protein